MISQNALDLSYNYFYKTIDRGLIEKFGPFGLVNILLYSVNYIRQFQTGFIVHYLIYFFLFILLFILLSTNNIFILGILLLGFLIII